MSSIAPPWLLGGLRCVVYFVLVLMIVYTLRHVLFTLNRLFGHQRHPYLDIDTADWPRVTVVVPAHNEAAVITHALDALADVDYPTDRYEVVAVDDRSSDETWAAMSACGERHPEVLRILRRTEGMPGKAAVLKEVSEALDSDILIVFDADYVPGRGLIKQIAAPFFDAEVGAVMGRVVPHNTASNLLTRLLDLERAGGYQVDQQARMNLHLLPQYGGSVGGVRLSALRAVGGWRVDVYAEDTDLTYRLMLAGFKTVYENRCECYEEVPEVWQERNRQIMRWAKGHNQVALRHLSRTLRAPGMSAFERLDAILLLGVYTLAPLLLFGFLCGFALFLLGEPALNGGALVVFGLVSFSALGNYAAFFEIAAALHLDGSRRRLRLLPLNFLNFLVSLINITRACASLLFDDTLRRRELRWDKTARYRVNGKTP
jgi:cellulose synthase/poly-beta-1,6-N-acetylglucosamine synthase-like glycosyltransferase